MSDIFISYASEDRARAKVLAGALERQGWSVWWDRKIPPGRQFSQVIKEAIDEAKCIIVLWSKESVNSDWVQNEASEGARRKNLVPALIDDVEIPFEFRRIQAARLVDWKGRSPHPEFDTLLEAVRAILGQKAGYIATSSIGMKLVYIPAGSFMMGSSDSAAQMAKEFKKEYEIDDVEEEDFTNELPQHQVRISKGFWMGQTVVTRGQYTSVMKAKPWSGNPGVRKRTDNPAVCVAWSEAVEFCSRLSQKEGKTYRLPTEAEWEYACRAGTTTRSSFGESDSSVGDYAWFWGNTSEVGQDYAHPVGQKKPNPWGLYDMHGNVWEWCSDFYDDDYYSNSPSVDPTGPSSGKVRSQRGGSWNEFPCSLRCSVRTSLHPSREENNVGFRVVRSQ